MKQFIKSKSCFGSWSGGISMLAVLWCEERQHWAAILCVMLHHAGAVMAWWWPPPTAHSSAHLFSRPITRADQRDPTIVGCRRFSRYSCPSFDIFVTLTLVRSSYWSIFIFPFVGILHPLPGLKKYKTKRKVILKRNAVQRCGVVAKVNRPSITNTTIKNDPYQHFR